MSPSYANKPTNIMLMHFYDIAIMSTRAFAPIKAISNNFLIE